MGQDYYEAYGDCLDDEDGAFGGFVDLECGDDCLYNFEVLLDSINSYYQEFYSGCYNVEDEYSQLYCTTAVPYCNWEEECLTTLSDC